MGVGDKTLAHFTADVNLDHLLKLVSDKFTGEEACHFPLCNGEVFCGKISDENWDIGLVLNSRPSDLASIDDSH